MQTDTPNPQVIPLTLKVNGETHAITATNLSDLLAELGYEPKLVATALNSRFIPLSQRQQQGLQSGDHIEILAPMQGG